MPQSGGGNGAAGGTTGRTRHPLWQRRPFWDTRSSVWEPEQRGKPCTKESTGSGIYDAVFLGSLQMVAGCLLSCRVHRRLAGAV